MSYNVDAQVFETQIVIQNNSEPAGATSGSIINSGTLSTLDTYVTGHTTINDVKITPNKNDIIFEQQATLTNNTNSFTDITGFEFDDSVCNSFKAIINVTVSAAQSKLAIWEIVGLYKPEGWVITSSFTGDLTGVQFSIRNDAGIAKIQYTNSNTSGSTVVRYRATTTAPPGSTPLGVSSGVIANTSGPFIADNLVYASSTNTLATSDISYTSNVLKVGGLSRIVGENTSAFVSFSNGGALTSMGDASVAKKMIVGQKIGIANTSPTYEIDVTGDINFTGSLFKNGSLYSGSEIWTTNGTSVFYTTGNIGLGTSAPSHQLDVSGGIRSSSGVTTSTVTATSVTSGSVSSTNLIGTNGTIGTLISTNANLTTGTVGTLLSTNADIATGTVGTLISSSATITNASVTTGTVGTLLSTNANVTTGTVGTLVGSTINATTISGGTVVATTYTGGSMSLSGNLTLAGTLTTVNITTTNISETNVSAGSVTATNVGVTTGTIGTLISTNANVTTGTVGTLISSSATITNASVTTGTVGTLISTNANVTTGTVGLLRVTTSTIGTLQANLGVMSEAIIVNSSVLTSMTAPSIVSTNISSGALNLSTGLTTGTARVITSLLAVGNSNTVGNIFTTGGNVGIGTISPGSVVDVKGASTWGTFRMAPSTSGGEVGVGFFGLNDFTASAQSTSGNWLLGTGMSGLGASNFGLLRNTTAMFAVSTSGNMTVVGDITAFGSISDMRFKENVENIQSEFALNKIKNLRPVTFTWKDNIANESKIGTQDAGFIAQEVEEVIDYAVDEFEEIGSGEVYKKIKHERIIPYLVGAIQRLEARIAELEKQ